MRIRKNLGFFLLFALFSFLSLTPPLFSECQDIYPDEWLDLAGMTYLPSLTILTSHSGALSPSHFIPDDHLLPRSCLLEFSAQALTLDLVSSVLNRR